MNYNISRNTVTTKSTTTYTTGDRIEKYEHTIEDVIIYGTNEVLTHLSKLLEDHNIFFSRSKTSIKFKTSTEKFEDIATQLEQKFRTPVKT